MLRGTLSVTALLIAAAGLGACGSGGGSSSSATTAAAGTLSREQLAYRVNSDCRWANQQLGIIEKERDYSPTKASYIRERMTSGIVRYQPPPDLQGQYDQFVTAWKQITALETEKATAIYKGDTAGYTQAKAQLKAEYAKFTSASNALGFSACA